MTDLEYIAHCYNPDLPPEEKLQFEKRIAEDPLFAEEVNFFLSTMQVVTSQDIAERKRQFKEIYEQNRKPEMILPVRKIIYALAAAAILTGVIIGYRFLEQRPSASQLAQEYVQTNLNELSTTMSSTRDTLQTALDLYNKGQLTRAVQLFETLVQQDSLNFNAQKYAGIVYLRLKDYDQAIAKFGLLENIPGINFNPGMFYHAIALMERDKPGDRDMAIKLLQAVVNEKLEGSEVARQWLKKM